MAGPGSTVARRGSRPPIDGVPVLHRVAVEHGSLRTARHNDTAADLAPDQLAAVTHDGGAARIIAPAGSGKTRVLTERARHLVQQWNLPAVGRLPGRVQQASAGGDAPTARPTCRGLQVRTLNAIALAIVNGSAPFARSRSRLATIDEPEVRRIIGRLVKFPRKRNADPVATWIEALSLARLGLRRPDDVERLYDGEVDGFAEVFPRYRARARTGRRGRLRRADLPGHRAAAARPGARATAQRACRLLLVDEFQDLTPAHLLLVRLLAGPDAAVFGVGDDDQTIYGYNGADPAWLIDFADLFPGAGEHPLEVNYRCPAGIVARRRHAAAPQPAPRAEGHPRARTPSATGSWSLRRRATPSTPPCRPSPPPSPQARRPADIAVLTRVNSLLAPVQVALRAAGVPTNGGVGREFVERTAVRAALAWLRLATAEGDFSPPTSARRCAARRARCTRASPTWVGEQSSVAGLRRLAGAHHHRTRREDASSEFAADIERLQRLAAQLAAPRQPCLAALRDSMGLANSIAKLDAHRQGMNRAAQNDDLTALAQLAALQPDPATFERWLRRRVGHTVAGRTASRWPPCTA